MNSLAHTSAEQSHGMATDRQPLWAPSPQRTAGANLTRFMHAAAARWNRTFGDYADLHRWSIAHAEEFWVSMWEFAQVRGVRGETVLIDGHRMPGARWFPEARLNFAENLLRRRDDTDALVFRGEDRVRRRLLHHQLYDDVSRMVQALRMAGVRPGDRVAGILPNMPEAVIAMLAAASLGATWCSCSPDFGVPGVLERLGQIEPKVLFAADGYYYDGKAYDCLEKLQGILAHLPSVARVVVVPYLRSALPPDGLAQAQPWSDFIATYAPSPIAFARLPFEHPLYIVFSSGTTGAPKCIVHGAGGTLLQHLKEHLLHTDIKSGDRIFYFTTCGWMMWNWLVSALASEATLLLYDGSPFYPSAAVLFDYADAENMTIFGTSAKYIDAVAKSGLVPREQHRLVGLKTILSTGSPLLPESFEFVYEKIKPDLCLSSISGGTDILSCFALGCPVLPVWRGELQCRGLGMAVEVWNDAGKAVRGKTGELVCVKPFPSMPIGFWNDADGTQYHTAYFERFPDVWHHGDYVEHTEHDGLIIYGRSDGVLNPGGVRIGTAEIYRPVEQIDEVLEALVVGQNWPPGKPSDVRVILFVRLRQGLRLEEGLVQRIKETIRAQTTPRHVPAKIVQVADIPRTKSGKIVELAVREVVHGRPVKNVEALANPEALRLFADLPELRA